MVQSKNNFLIPNVFPTFSSETLGSIYFSKNTDIIEKCYGYSIFILGKHFIFFEKAVRSFVPEK